MTLFVSVGLTGPGIIDALSYRWVAQPTAIALGRYERGSNVIRSRVDALMQSIADTFPEVIALDVTWDNAPQAETFSPAVPNPTGAVNVDAAISVEWSRASRRGTAGLVSRAYRFEGTLRVSLFSPRMEGDGAIRECADFIADELRWESNSDIRFETPRIAQGGAGNSRATLSRTVEVPFYLDEDNDKLASVLGTDGNFATVGEVCRTRFETFIEDPAALTVTYDNAPSPTTNGLPWIVVDVLQGATQLASLGIGNPQRYRSVGIMQASIHVDLGEGDGDALAIADDIFDSFHNVADRGVQFKTPAIIASGRVGSYWRVIVQVPFQAEQIL